MIGTGDSSRCVSPLDTRRRGNSLE